MYLFLENEYLGQKTEKKFTFFKLCALNRRQWYEQEAAVWVHLGNHCQRIPSPRLGWHSWITWPQFCRKDLILNTEDLSCTGSLSLSTLPFWAITGTKQNDPVLYFNSGNNCCSASWTLLSISWYKAHWNVYRKEVQNRLVAGDGT